MGKGGKSIWSEILRSRAEGRLTPCRVYSGYGLVRCHTPLNKYLFRRGGVCRLSGHRIHLGEFL